MVIGSLWHRFILWAMNFHKPWVQPKKRKKKEKDFDVRGEVNVNTKHKNEKSIFYTNYACCWRAQERHWSMFGGQGKGPKRPSVFESLPLWYKICPLLIEKTLERCSFQNAVEAEGRKCFRRFLLYTGWISNSYNLLWSHGGHHPHFKSVI